MHVAKLVFYIVCCKECVVMCCKVCVTYCMLKRLCCKLCVAKYMIQPGCYKVYVVKYVFLISSYWKISIIHYLIPANF